MNPLITKIQESEIEFDERYTNFLFLDFSYNRDRDHVKHLHRSFLISLFRANIERLEKEKKDENVEFEDESLKFGQQRVEDYRFGFNEAIDQEIAFMRETIKSLETWKI